MASSSLSRTLSRAAVRIILRGRLPDRTVTAEIVSCAKRTPLSAKPSADNVALVLEGRLAAGDVTVQAGLSAQPRGLNRRYDDPPVNQS